MQKNNIDSAITFLKGLKGKKVTVVSHDDSDGSCSAALIIRLLKKIDRHIHISYFSTRGRPSISDGLMKDIISKKSEFVITCDFAGDIDKSAQILEQEGVQCLMIDHHIVSDYKFPDNTIYINPLLDGKTMPCAAFIYDLCNRIFDIKEHLWIAGVGTIEDFGATDRTDIIEGCMKQYPELFEKKDMDNSKLFDTTFGLVGKILSSASTWNSYKGAELATKVLLEVNSPRDFLGLENKNVRMMFEKYQIIEKEIRDSVRKFEEESVVSGALRYHIMDSEYPIKSKVSTIISAKNEYYNEVIAVIEENNKTYSLSLRNQSGDFDLNGIVRECLAGLDGVGGGHKKASGAVVAKKDFDVFMGRLKEKIKN
ncbi:MAG: hypothetical protein GQ477_05290 [Nanohaloarchaea archaeon]|nr:hypothetical protein [Candidatus Nanohaloarchaea archaeon]